MTKRYHIVAMLLHWGMAISFATMIAAGLWMTGAIKDPDQRAVAFDVYQLHKSAGLTLFLLAGIRLAWRLFEKPPSLPSEIAGGEAVLAHLGHWALYVMMFALPLTGWAMVSASIWGLPTIWFGLFEVPHIWFLSGLEGEDKASVEAGFKASHSWLAYGFIALIAGHILAALKHQFLDKIPLLHRMGIGRSK